MSNLAVTAAGDIALGRLRNDVDRVGAVSSTGNVLLWDADDLTVGTVDGVHGVNSAQGYVRLGTEHGDLSIADTGAAADLAGTSSVFVHLRGEEALFQLASGATSTGDQMVVFADKMDLAGTVEAGVRVQLAPPPEHDGRAIDLGSVGNTAIDTLELSNAELDRITTGTLRVGDANSGPITITSPTSPAGTGTLHLTSGGAVTDGSDGAIIVSNLAIESVGSVTLDNASADSGNAVDVMAAEVSGAGNGFHFENNGPLQIGSVDGVTGISTNGGGITIVTHSPLTVNGPVSDSGGGDIQLVAANDGGEDDHLTINGSIQASGGDGSVVLQAGTDLAINDGGDNSISASGAGTIAANVERTARLNIGVELRTDTGSVTVTAQNASVEGTDGDDELAFNAGTTEGEIDLTSSGEPIATLVVPATGEIEASGGGGNDTVIVDSTITNTTILSGGDGNDVLEGGGGDNTLDGGDGDDSLTGGTGTNTLSGGDGDDTIQDGGGTNTVIGGSGSNTFLPGDGENSFETEAGSTVPEVYADTYSIPEDDKLTVSLDQGVLANDLDPEGRSLFAKAITSTAHGNVSLADDGSFTYCPSDDFNGTDTFTYQASNGTENSSEATVTIQVAPVNDAPVVATASRETDEDIPVDIDLRTLVSDVETADDDLLFAVGGAVHGSVALLDDGYTVTFTPSADFPSPNPTGAASFTYDVTDTGDPAGTPGNAITVSETQIDVTVRNLVDLSGTVFDDLNNDGAQQLDENEQGIPGVTIALQQQDGTVLDTRVTDVNGHYDFHDANLTPGTYQLVESQPTTLGDGTLLLDGDETAGDLDGTVDNTQDCQTISNIVVDEGDPDAAGYTFAEIRASDIQGMVWEDFNDDAELNFGEKAIPNVTVTLAGEDDRGHSVGRTVTTDDAGVYMFIDLRPGTYTISEVQPTSPVDYVDGQESLGTVNEAPSGSVGDDLFSAVELPAPGSAGENYNFGERPPAGGEVTPGQTAGIGFWQNKNGQELLESLNDGPDATQLGNWMATTFPNLYGDPDRGDNVDNPNDLAGRTNENVADFYRDLFRRKKRESMRLGLTGPAKMDAQVMATALACYVTNDTLAGTTASDYGFQVTEYGVGTSTFDVGDGGEAFGVADYTDDLTVLDLLFATNDLSWNGVLYDLNQDGDTEDEVDDTDETLLRQLANDVYSAINQQGE